MQSDLGFSMKKIKLNFVMFAVVTVIGLALVVFLPKILIKNNVALASQNLECYGYYSWGGYNNNDDLKLITSFTNFEYIGYSPTYSSTTLANLITSAENSGLKIVLNISSYFYYNLNTTTESDWRNYLNVLKTKLGANSKRIWALYLFDEPEIWFPNNPEKVDKVINLTKEILPDIKTFVIFHSPWVQGSYLVNNTNLDLIGIDPYFLSESWVNDMTAAGLDPYACGAAQTLRFDQMTQGYIYWIKSGGGHIQYACWTEEEHACWPGCCTQEMLNNINAILNKDTDKKIILVGQDFRCNQYGGGWNISQIPSLCQQKWYYDWAKKDPDIAGLMWYEYASNLRVEMYSTWTAQGIMACIGVGPYTPDILAAHKQWGLEVLCGNQETNPFCASNGVSYKNSDQAKCKGQATIHPGGSGTGVCDSACGADQKCHGITPGTNNCDASCKSTIDTTPPSVSLISPASGATVSGSVTVSANATDNVGVSKVEFYVDSVLKNTDSVSPYSFALDSKLLANASHTLTAKAYDAAGNISQHSISVIVNNDTTPPTVSITAPASGAGVSGTVNVAANALDNVAVAKVEFYMDGTLKATDTASPYAYSWVTTQYANGSHAIMVKAYDAAGNTGQTSATVTVNNVTPTPTVNLLVNGSNGPITIPYNTSASLSWTSTNATSCTASGDWSGTKSTSGSLSTGNLTSSKIYTITCTGTGGSASDSVTVNVSGTPTITPTPTPTVVPPTPTPTPIPTPAVSCSIWASPNTIYGSGSSILTWTSNNATSCTASGASDWNFNMLTSGSRNVIVSNSTVYGLSCSGPNGSVACYATISVSPRPTPTPLASDPFVYLVSSNSSIAVGQSATLIWSSINTDTCSASGGWSGIKDTVGLEVVSPIQDTVYILSCTGSAGTAGNSILIKTTNPTPTPTIRPTPTPTPTSTPTPSSTPTPTPTHTPTPTPAPILGPVVIPTLPVNPTTADYENLLSALQRQLAYLRSLLATQQGTTLISGYQFTQNLKIGDSGEAVRQLQIFLKSQGSEIYPEGLVSGYFGNLTRLAVERFQKKYDIVYFGNESTTGYGSVGPQTRAKLNELLNK